MKKNTPAIITGVSRVDRTGSEDTLYFMGMPVYRNVTGCGCLRGRKLLSLFGRMTEYVKDGGRDKAAGETVTFLLLSFSLFSRVTEYVKDGDGCSLTVVRHTLLSLPVLKWEMIRANVRSEPC